MNAQLGVYLLLLALLAALYALIASFVGGRKEHDALVESARNAMMLTWPLLTMAALLLIRLLVSGDFNTEFVWSVTDRAMPTYLKVTALWGGQAGSLVFWSWLMSTFTAGAMLRNWQRERDLMPYVITASAATLAFFLLLVVFWENPFARYWQTQTGEVMTALFSSSNFMGSISSWRLGVAEKLPGMLGVIAKGAIPFSAPGGSVLLQPADG